MSRPRVRRERLEGLRLRQVGSHGRTAQGLGSFALKGRWYVAPERVDLDVDLDRTGLGEITALMRGQTGSVHGTLSARVHLGGPIDNIGILGRLEHRRRAPLGPAAAERQGWPLDIRGRLNLIAQQFELQSTPPATRRCRCGYGSGPTITSRGRAGR